MSDGFRSDGQGRLAGKVAVIAGAGGGMGSATPLRFAHEGAKVLLVARRAEPLAVLAKEINERGGEAPLPLPTWRRPQERLQWPKPL